MPIQGTERYAGPSYRFARPLNVGQIEESSATFKSTYLSPEEYQIRTKAVNSTKRLRIRLSFSDLVEGEIRAQAEFLGQRGRVQLPVKSEHFLEDAAMLRRYVIDMARSLMEGAEPHSYYRRGGSFSFYFSSDPERSSQALLDCFILPDRQGWNNDGRVFLFYPEKQAGAVRELEIFDAWIVNRIAVMELSAQVIDPAEIASQAGVTEKRLITQIGRINDLRHTWDLPPLPRHAGFREIENAVKQLRREANRWPSLTEVAQRLAVDPQALKTSLDLYNQKRAAKNDPPLLLLDGL